MKLVDPELELPSRVWREDHDDAAVTRPLPLGITTGSEDDVLLPPWIAVAVSLLVLMLAFLSFGQSAGSATPGREGPREATSDEGICRDGPPTSASADWFPARPSGVEAVWATATADCVHYSRKEAHPAHV
ncbi:MAG TPA: hypothetical protein VHM72_11655 [Solirubrobacteraceae bacterium]|nr:hypothetical protein [Solirubrobacteraceae bacterium]